MRKLGRTVLLLLLSISLCMAGLTPLFAASGRIKCTYTRQEQEYIESLDGVTVALSPDNFPYSTMETGTMTGIFPELLALISYESGISFTLLPCETYEDYTKIKEQQEVEVVFSTHVSETDAKEMGYQLTSPYLMIPYSKIELRENQAESSKVAALKQPSAEASEAVKYYYSDQILYCESKKACMEALNQHQCEAVIINSYEAEYMQYSDVKNQYVVKELYDNNVAIAAGINQNCDPLLYSIMEKSLQSVDELTKKEIINRNTQQLERSVSITELMYMNPILFIGGFFILFILVCGIIVLLYRVKKTGLMQEKAAEYKRFVGYICMAVDTVTEVNLQTRTLVRYLMQDGVLLEQKDLYPKDVLEIYHEKDRERVKDLVSDENLQRLCETGEVLYFECRMKWNHASEYRWCTCILQGIKPSRDKPMNLLLILKDTDAIKSNEEKQRRALEDAFQMAKQASQAKGIFLSKMSHEIRTPLNAVIGYLGIAKDSGEDQEKIRHCVDNSEIAAKHLLHIINDVLDISFIESGKMKIADEDFDLKKAITDISTIFFQNAKNKKVRFEVIIQELTEEWVKGDSLRLNQVLMNLLSNAVKFTPEDGVVRLTVKQLNQDQRKVYIQFTITDSGIGMSKEYLSRLFQPFEQESASTAQKYGGTGLGLSITYNLVKMMGGTIDVQSRQGEGSTFTVTLHFDRTREHPLEKPANADYSHVRALVVDDQREEGQYVKAMLKRCGVKADIVTSGKDGLKRLLGRQDSEYAYDLCILDWNMPEMNGMETALKIRENFGEDLPIIIATAYDITEFNQEAKDIGVNKVVSKPLFQSTLFDLLVTTFGEYDPGKQQSGEREPIDLNGIHVLLAEDNEMNMEIAVTVLTKAGGSVDSAVNGQEVYEKFVNAKQKTYALILMDVQMPILNGYEATRKIRSSSHPEAKTIPIIAMTANAFAEDVAEALANGMNDHIAKPINYDKLFEVVKKYAES